MALSLKNEVIAEICSQFSIIQCVTAPYHPASNGLVERANRKILEALRHVTAGLEDTWEEWLPHVAASINSTYNSSIGETPHFVVFGVDKRLPYDVLLDHPRPLYNPDDYAKLQLSVFQKIHGAVHRRLTISQDAMLNRQHKKAQPVTIREGDLVFILDPERSSKLSPRYSGPCRVVSRGHGNKFTIRFLDSGAERVAHVDNLKRVSPDFPLPATSTEATVSNISEPPPPSSDVTPPYRQKLRSANR